MSERNFKPNWVSPPGQTILDLLEELGWTQAELAIRLGYTRKHVNQLIKGKVPITEDAALKLERVLGSTVGFWLIREARYRESLARLGECKALKEDLEWLKLLPVSQMSAFGWIKKFSSKDLQVAECFRFFGVASAQAWTNKWGKTLAAFRSKKLHERHKGGIAAWLRQSEIEATTFECTPYDSQGFKKNLQILRELTKEEKPQIFIPKLSEICAKVGVIITLVPAPKGCPVSGAARWLTSDKALITLSDRYKTNDQFWFSFFHEAGHLILHEKRIFFIDTEGQLKSEEENEADTYASNILISTDEAKKLSGLGADESEIRKFAEKIGIAPGIIVGRMQREKLLVWNSSLNRLKTKVEFSQIRAS
jgi:HTH-type transcriptional regulator/antitoxin HigA